MRIPAFFLPGQQPQRLLRNRGNLPSENRPNTWLHPTQSGIVRYDRRTKLRYLLDEPDGIRFSDHHAGDGDVMFRHACSMGLKGIVSTRRDAPYRSGRSKVWLKCKNPDSPAMRRLEDATW